MTRLLRYLAFLAIVLVALDSPLRIIAQDNWTMYTEADGLASHRIMTVAIVPDETVWVGPVLAELYIRSISGEKLLPRE